MGIPTENSTIYTLLFADDQLVIAQDYEDIEYMTRKLIEEYNKWGLKINLEKTLYMSCGEEMKDLVLEDGMGCIKGCEECEYLGVKINSTYSQESDIKYRIQKGRSAIAMLNGVWWDKTITIETKLQIYKSIIRSTITYGAETWHLNTNLRLKLLSTEMNCFRRSTRHSKLEKIRNTTIRQEMGVNSTLLDFVSYKQLEWYGHVRRMPETRLPRQILEWIPPGRGKRGRPRKTWMDDIRSGMKERGLEERDWEAREEWRKKIRI